MPLFSNKFSPSKPIARKKNLIFHNNVIRETGINESFEKNININLSGHQFSFTKGSWIEEKNDQEIEEINKEDIPVSNDCCECLKEENDYLRNKCESLLNLITKLTFNSKNQDKEINRLRRELLLLREGGYELT